MNLRVLDLCIEQILPQQIFMANQRKTMSMPASLVPNGGFITTISTSLRSPQPRTLICLISANTRSQSAPSTFSSSRPCAPRRQSQSSSKPTTQLACKQMTPHMSMPVPIPISATVYSSMGSLLQIWKSSFAAMSGGVMCCSRFIFYFQPNLKSSMSCRKSSMCFCFNLPFIYQSYNCKAMALKLASGSYDGTIKFWNPSTGRIVENQEIKLTKLNLIPNRIEVSENKQKLIAGMYNVCKIYDLTRPEFPQRSFDTNFKGNVTAVGFRKHDQIIYTGCEDGFLRIFDLRKKGQIRTLKQNKPINCAVMHPNDVEILSGDEGGFFRLWDIANQKQRISILSDNEVGIRSISVSQNGQNIAFADNRGFIQPFYMEKGEHLSKCKSIQAHDDYILKIEISPNGKFISTCSADKKIKLFKINNEGQKFEIVEYKQLKGHLKWVWDCRFSCDSAYLISCSTDATLKLWGVEKGELIKTLKGHEKGVICLALNDIADP